MSFAKCRLQKVCATLLGAALVCVTAPVGAAVADIAEDEDGSGAYETATTYALGSAATQLAAGAYSVPVSARNASDHTRASAAASAFHSTATLTVAADGTASIVTEIETVEVMGIEGHASDIKVYQQQKADGSVDKSGELKPVTVLRNRTVTPANGGPSEVPQLITFEIPDASWDGVYLNTYVDAMSSSPDLWLSIDYANAVEPGSAVTYTGTARVMQFGEYDVTAKVSVLDDVIVGVELEGSGFEGSMVETNRTLLAAAISGMKSKWNNMWIGHGHSNAEALYYAGGDGKLDTVSGATYSSKAIRDAVMDALSMSWSEDTIAVPSSVKAGTYSVPVSYYTDIVLHQLAGAEKAPATLTVAADGGMRIDIDLVNGTAREPLYTLAFNGYYADNDAEKPLSVQGASVKEGTVAYSDEHFAAGTPVVTHVSVPLVGGLAKEYATQVRLYVPAMNKLTGSIKGYEFDHGTFNGNAFIKVHWNDIEQVGQSAATPKPTKPKVVNYTINKAKVTVKDGKKAAKKGATQITLGKKVKRIAKGAFKSAKKATVLVVNSTKLKKAACKGCLKGSKIKTVKVPAKKLKAYKKIFGKKLTVKK